MVHKETCTHVYIRAAGGKLESITGERRGVVQWTLTAKYHAALRAVSQQCITMRTDLLKNKNKNENKKCEWKEKETEWGQLYNVIYLNEKHRYK